MDIITQGKLYIPIKNWSESDKPRERLLNQGPDILSDAELIAILIGSGTKEESAIEVARKILRLTNNNLHQLGKLEVQHYLQIKGVGEAKAVSIAAALELGKRRGKSDAGEKLRIRCSKDAFEIVYPRLDGLNAEEFWMIFLDRANNVIQVKRLSKGGIGATVVDPKVVFRDALFAGASSLIVAHNHPSGNLQASGKDMEITEKLKKAASYLDMTLLDHLIIGDKEYLSMADEGIF